MHRCPHCKEFGISNWDRFKTGSLNPAKCKNCNAKSYVKSKVGFQGLLLAGVPTCLLSSLGLYLQSGFLILLSIPIFIFLYYRYVSKFNLVPL